MPAPMQTAIARRVRARSPIDTLRPCSDLEPLLCDGDAILIDRKPQDRQEGRIFVVRTGDGLVVKRAGRCEGGWLLVSEHPSWAPIAWPGDAETIGQAVWTARSLV